MRKMTLGDFDLSIVSDGTYPLDGGAFFGVVPKVMWSRKAAADERNFITAGLNSLLIRTGKQNILVETGIGSKLPEKMAKVYGQPAKLLENLQAAGVAPDEIDIVINTHLHFDHAGGDTEFDESGRPIPQFARARYIIQKDEWEDANHPHERNKASYLAENFEPLQDSKVLDLVEGEFEMEPGLKVIRSGGHTRGHQCVLIESEGQSAIFFGDLIPTRSHVPLPYIMSYDLYPVDTLETKRRLLARAKEKNWLLLFQHDPRQRAGYLAEVDGRTIVVAKTE